MAEGTPGRPAADQRESVSRWQRFVRAWGAWRWGSIALLAPGLALFVFFVVQPEPALSTGPALLMDNVLRAASLLALVSVVVLLIARDDIAEPASVVASAAVLLLAGAVLTAGLWSSARDPWMLTLAVVALLLSAWNAWLHVGAWADMKVTATKGTAALLAVAAVPAFNFWAETSYLPSSNRVALVGSVGVEAEEAPDTSDHLVVSSVLANPADVRAFVIISNLTVCHWFDESDRQAHSEIDLSDLDNCQVVSRPFGRRSWLDPEAELTMVDSVRTRENRPFVEFRLRLAYARADRVVLVPGSLRPVDHPAELGDCVWAEQSDLRAPSRLSSLALEGSALMYGDVEGDGALSYYFGHGDDPVCGSRDSSRALEQYLGLTEYTTIWVGWPDIPEVPRPDPPPAAQPTAAGTPACLNGPF